MSFTNAQLAQKIADLILFWSSFNEEYKNWLGGAVDGGPSSDGKFPMTDYTGVESLVDCPAKLSDNVSGYVGLVSASADAAAASEAAASTSESNAGTSAATATAQAVLADADRIAAELAETNAQDSAVTAIAQSNLAAVRAAAALVSENAAADSAAAALASEIAAAASAVEAAASALLTQPDLFAKLADDEVITGNYDFPGFTTDYVAMDLTAAHAVSTGHMAWNADAGTIDVGLLGSDVVLQLGQEMHFHVKADEAITNGDVIYASGAIGASGKISVSKFIGDGTIPAYVVLGIATESISVGNFGYVTQFGAVRGLDTTGGAENWTLGDILFPSPTVTGAMTNIRPVAPQIAMPIGFIVNVHATNGTVMVRPTPPHTIAEQNDVDIDTPLDGDLLVYNTADSHWDNQSLSEAGVSALGHVHSFSSLTSKPTTIAGYGITDAYTKSQIDTTFGNYTLTSGLSIANWNTAYGWGNHASAGYAVGNLANYTLTSGLSISNWNTAYGWGNHASGGYLSAVPTTYAPRTAQEMTSSQDLNDLEANQTGFYYQSSNADTPGNNYPNDKAGSLLVQKSAVSSTQLYITYPEAGNEMFFRSKYNTAFGAWHKVWHDGNLTNNSSNWNTAYGWGNHASGGYLTSETSHADVANFEAVTGGFGSVQVDGEEGSTGWTGYNIQAEVAFMWNTAGKRGGLYDDYGNQWFVQCYSGGAVQLYQAGTERLRTTTSGIKVTGSIDIDGLTELNNLTDGSLRVTTTYGYMDIGPKNASWCHVYTGIANGFYLNKKLVVNGGGVPYYSTSAYAGGKITVATTAPSSPTKGDQWFDTS